MAAKGGLKKVKIVPDENLAKIVGNKPITVFELNKKLWEYIKRKGLRKG